MARINGHGPQAYVESDTRPPRLPYVLLCHTSGARCGRVWTVNKLSEWRPAVESRIAHEKVCTVHPLPILALPGDMIT
jgi:hypothetical protein